MQYVQMTNPNGEYMPGTNFEERDMSESMSVPGSKYSSPLVRKPKKLGAMYNPNLIDPRKISKVYE